MAGIGREISGWSQADAPWLTRGLLALAAFGVATDVTIATHLGSTGGGSLIVSLVLAAPLVVAAGWQLATGGRVRPAAAPLVAIALFVAWSAASIFWTIDEEQTLQRAMTNAQLLVFAWLCWQLARTGRDLRALLAGFVGGCGVLVLLTWRNYFTDAFVVWGRFAADGFDPNDMSVYLALGIPMAAYLALAGERKGRLLMLLYVPAAFSALALSGSRAGLLTAGLAVAGVAAWVARRSVATTTWTLGLVVAGVLCAAALAPEDSWSRLGTVQAELTGGTMGDRTQIWRAGLALLPRHPLAGVGAGGFPAAVVSSLNVRVVAHSTPLAISVELGALGLLLFLSSFALVLWGVRRAGPNEKALASILVVTVCLGAASLTWEGRKPLWFVLLIGAVLTELRAGADRERP